MVRRFIQAALLFAVMVPILMLTKGMVATLDQRGLDISSGIVIGMVLMFCLWQWDNRLRR
jgi:ribose/xylose/arabinose/galactoside ABC-type transport system permease subunit